MGQDDVFRLMADMDKQNGGKRAPDAEGNPCPLCTRITNGKQGNTYRPCPAGTEHGIINNQCLKHSQKEPDRSYRMNIEYRAGKGSASIQRSQKPSPYITSNISAFREK